MDSLWHDFRLVLISAVVFFIGSLIAGRFKAAKGPDEKSRVKEADAPPAAPQAVPATPPPARVAVPGPALSLPDGALYAVITAAVAQTLAEQGIQPEGGFVITSVKAL